MAKIRIDELFKHRRQLAQINAGYEMLKRGESIRTVMVN